MPVDPLSLEPGANGAAVQIVNDLYRRMGILERNGGGTTTSSSSGSVADATTTVKGKLKLANQLAGTADAPTINPLSSPTVTGLSVGGTGTDVSLAKTVTGQLDLNSTAAETRLSFQTSGVEKYRFWKTGGGNLQLFNATALDSTTDAPGGDAHITLNAGGATTAHDVWLFNSLPTAGDAQIIRGQPSVIWDAARAKHRIEISTQLGFINGIAGRGLGSVNLDDNPTNDVENSGAGLGFSNPFTQREGFSFRALSTGSHNDRGSLIGVSSSITSTNAIAAVNIASYVSPTVTLSSAVSSLVNTNTVVIAGSSLSALNGVWTVTNVLGGGTTFDLSGTPPAGSTGASGTAQKVVYQEADCLLADVTANVYGQLGRAAELDVHVNVPCRATGAFVSMTPALSYPAWNNAAIFGANSSWRDTGTRGFWVQNTTSSSFIGGTGLYISAPIAAPWKRAIVVNSGAGTNTAGTDIFCIDGATGYIGSGVTTNQTSTIPARLTLGAGTPTTAAEGIQLGITSPVNFFRSGTAAATLQGTLRPQDGIVGSDGIVPTTGAISPNWPGVATEGTSQTPVVGTFYIVAVEIPRNQTVTGAAFMVGSAAPGAERAIVYMWDANGTLVRNSTLTPAANNIQTGCIAGPSGASGTHRWCQLAFTGTYAAKGPARYFLGVQLNTATLGIFKSYGVSYAGLGKSQAGVFGTSAPIGSVPTTFNTGNTPMMYVY